MGWWSLPFSAWWGSPHELCASDEPKDVRDGLESSAQFEPVLGGVETEAGERQAGLLRGIL